jgi:protease-4
MGNFFKQLIASALGTLIALGLVGGGTVALMALLIVGISRSSEGNEPTVADGTVLEFDLAMAVPTVPSEDDGSEALGSLIGGDRPARMALRSLVDALAIAAKDDRIAGLYLYSSDQSMGVSGYATLREVRRALDQFRQTDKPILAYGTNWSETTYYLASVADEMWLNPFGTIEFNGLASSELFMAEALEKYGVGVQVVRSGRYKAAVEPFTLRQRSPESRQQLQALLGDLWQEVVTTVTTHRRVTPQQLAAIANQQGVMRAERAAAIGAIDAVAYEDEILDKLGKLAPAKDGEAAFEGLSLVDYGRAARSDRPDQSLLGRAKSPAPSAPEAPPPEANRPEPGEDNSDGPGSGTVALLYANGAIGSQVSADGINGQQLAQQMRDLRQDDEVAAVVLRINSPGGSATASEVIQREVQLTRDRKPVVVSMGDYAASGGYWIATYGSHIVAEPTTITGSIGVFGLLPNVQQLGANNGLTWDTVKTSPLADLGTLTRPKTPAELALFQESVNWTYDRFLQKVSQSRKLPRQRVAELAAGRVWSGADARQVGLVDELGGLETAIAAAVRLAKLGGESWQLAEYPKPEGLAWGPLRGLMSQSAPANSGEAIARPLAAYLGLTPPRSRSPLQRWAATLQTELAWLDSLDDPHHVYARLPYRLEVR